MESLLAATRTTPLHDNHVSRGAAMVDFSGWSMPLWYPSGAVAEHQRVITAAGLFDTSHMSFVTVSGSESLQLLQLCFTRDLFRCTGNNRVPLSPGKCVYGVFLNEEGNVIDDALVYQVDADGYLIVVNAGMGTHITEHLRSHAVSRDVFVADITGKIGKMDLQGPASGKVLVKMLKDPESTLRGMRYFTFKGSVDPKSGAVIRLDNGIPLMVSRTGYTGEFGFELFVESERLGEVWEMVLRAGEDVGVIPCGLAARDSLRAGACLALSHQDIGPWPFINNPWHFALPYNETRTGFTKTFIGDCVLDLRESAEHTYAFVGWDPRKVSSRDPGVVLDARGNRMGTVLTCVADMAIARYDDRIYSIASRDKPPNFKARGLSCGFLKVSSELHPGMEVGLKDNRRTIQVTIVDDIRPDRTARGPMQDMIC